MYREKIRSVVILLMATVFVSCSGLEDPFNEENRAAALETYDEAAMETSLKQILQWHREHQTGIPEALKPGRSRAEILEAFESLPCRPTEELIRLWSWRDGSGIAATPFIWYHNFLPMDKAIATYKRFTINRLTGLGWQRNWIPVFEFEGEWYFTECYDDVQTAGPVGFYFIEETRPIYAYMNLTRLLETQAALFNRDVVRWNFANEAMEEDIRRVSDIQLEFNKGTEFPYAVE